MPARVVSGRPEASGEHLLEAGLPRAAFAQDHEQATSGSHELLEAEAARAAREACVVDHD